MGQRLRTVVAPAVIAFGALLCSGCPNPNTYATPRTAGSGHVHHSLALESWGFRFKDPVDGTTVSATFPTLPTYTLRVGLGDQFEIGARIANFSSLGGELKWNPVRSRVFDAAINPSFQFFQLSATDSSGTDTGFRVIYFHVPLLLGLNLSKSITLVASPGVSYGVASASITDSSSDRSQASGTTGIMARAGLGIDLRVSPSFALHPEVTLLHSFREGDTNLYMFGLGFNFGTLPSYADLDDSAPPPGNAPYIPPPGTYPPPPPGNAPYIPPPGTYAPPPGAPPPPPAYPPPS